MPAASRLPSAPLPLRRVLPLALALACSAPPEMMDAGPPDSGPPPVTQTDLCQRLAEARCALNTRCYTAYSRLPTGDCVAIEQARCLLQLQSLGNGFDQGTLTISRERLESCEIRMRTSACPPSFAPDVPLAGLTKPFTDCSVLTGSVVGRVDAGSPCSVAQECSPGTVCVRPGGVCRGTCDRANGIGQRCGFGCLPGLFCGADGGCQSPTGVDTACMRSRTCEGDLICRNGACRPRRKLGEACVVDVDRLSQCEPGLACDVVPFVMGATGTCVLPRKPGESCKFHWTCEPGSVCSGIDWSPFPAREPDAGICFPPSTQGQPCSATQFAAFVGDECAAGLSCAVGMNVCQPLAALGNPCRPSLQNCVGVNVFCKPTSSGDVGTCASPPGRGERCSFRLSNGNTVSIPCQSGLFCDSTSTLTCLPPNVPLGGLCTTNTQCQSDRCAVQEDSSLRCSQACQ
jgi:hypothetical protein